MVIHYEPLQESDGQIARHLLIIIKNINWEESFMQPTNQRDPATFHLCRDAPSTYLSSKKIVAISQNTRLKKKQPSDVSAGLLNPRITYCDCAGLDLLNVARVSKHTIRNGTIVGWFYPTYRSPKNRPMNKSHLE